MTAASMRWTILAQAPLQFRHSLAQVSKPRFGRLQGRPGRRKLRVLGLDHLAQPGIGGTQRGHQRGKILPRRLGGQIGHRPP
jgi:hypothetical protein